MVVHIGEELYLGRRGITGIGGISMSKTTLKVLRSSPKVLKSIPINYSLVLFVLEIIRNELCP